MWLAGAAHTQIITTPFVPDAVETLVLRAAQFHRQWGQCSACRVLVQAPEGEDLAEERLVAASEHFVASAPFAARDRYRVLIAPRRHSPDFLSLTDLEAADLALLLQRVLAFYYHQLADTPFNVAVWTCPVASSPAEAASMEPSFHWYLGLYPRAPPSASGFKNATNIAFMRSLPEDYAATMRTWIREERSERGAAAPDGG